MTKLKPVLKSEDTSTADNSSQISNEAAAVLIIRRDLTVSRELSFSIIDK